MRRSGFTMIELIFVIVILGILASVAIPKLAATRDDAKMAGAATEINVAVSEIAAFYAASGDFNLTVPTIMSNSFAGANWNINPAVNQAVGTASAIYQVNNNAVDCIRIDFGGADINVTYDANLDGDYSNDGLNSPICDNIKRIVAETNTTVGGNTVTF